jgi:hypothetical protein
MAPAGSNSLRHRGTFTYRSIILRRFSSSTLRPSAIRAASDCRLNRRLSTFILVKDRVQFCGANMSKL